MSKKLLIAAFDEPNHTQTPNALFELLPQLGDAELRVTLVMVRHTLGYHQERFKMGIGKLAAAAGLSEQGARNGAQAAEERGIFRRVNPDNKKEAEWELVLRDPNHVDPQPSGGQTPTQLTSDPNTVDHIPPLKETIKENIKQSGASAPVLTADEIQQAGEKVEKILQLQGGNTWQGRELVRADLLEYADWYNSVTNQVLTKRVQKAWWKAMQAWKDEGLRVSDLQEAFDAMKKWRMVSDPNMLTKDAAAIKAVSTIHRETAPAMLDAHGIPESW